MIKTTHSSCICQYTNILYQILSVNLKAKFYFEISLFFKHITKYLLGSTMLCATDSTDTVFRTQNMQNYPLNRKKKSDLTFDLNVNFLHN